MDKVGRYRLIRRLGAGSFATVWLGHDDDLDVPVAVKVLADNWANNDDVRNRFLGEARLMRQIRDDRIVRVYDIGSMDDGRPYFVMDFADGGSLEDLRKQGIAPAMALRLCAEASRALHVLHSHDVIHRDVTPGNVLLNHAKDSSVKVLIADLGVAKSMVDMGATMTAGTPAYMALEQANGVAKLDHRADIYSLAAVTYAMLTGRPPFPVKTLADVLQRDPNLRPAPVAATLGAPPQLDQVLAAALSTQPGLRPRTALELADELDRCADQLAGPGPGTAPTPAPESAFGRSHAQAYTTPPTPLPQGPGGPPPQMMAPQQAQSQAQPQSQPQAQHRTVAPPPQTGAPMAPQQNRPAHQPAPYPAQPAPQRRPFTFWLLVGLAAVALFVVSLVVTIFALS
ncbi:MAG TPA: serine/threonine protein kinase [Candidatus Avipropionibacterium avicola]|uniref:non-specific serine/threonine protein kinase n=1 Tax=Candidatus Avipropionibacterium avicola TaxID=2840701 RepID=A0A9D1KLN5_9ACTN|nr:serine/threonine protein kinase [Candidatus Avipropionibacterium avicola]